MQENVSALKVESFSKRYRGRTQFAVRDVSLNIQPGEFHGFIGANGAGKTTTIKSLIGAYAKANYTGEITFFGHPNVSVEAKKLIGYIPEKADFPNKMSALAYLHYMGFVSGFGWKESKVLAYKTLDDVGLSALAYKSPNSFSSGQKKKLLLAQALLPNPQVLIMDEPAANLDPQARMEFFQTLKALNANGKTIFISSHILSELEQYISHLTILDGGKVVYTGGFKELVQKNQNRSSYVMEFEEEAPEAVKDYFQKKKIKGLFEKNKVTFDLDSDKDFTSFVTFLGRESILFTTLSRTKKSLEEIYSQYVQYGSNDTRGSDLKMRSGGNL